VTVPGVTVWKEATRRLRSDPAFGPVVRRVGPVRLAADRGEPFAALAQAIIYQQLAGRAAATIHGRFVAALGGRVTPRRVLATDDVVLRAAGLSAGKLASVRDLAAHFASRRLDLGNAEELSDEEIVARLTRVRGVGPWTAQMFLLFDLQRPDVWPTGDLGVRNGMGRVLGLEQAPGVREMEWIGVGYRPFRSAVAWYCWRALES
jgi:DNA-3-methyladenine glycosylase II